VLVARVDTPELHGDLEKVQAVQAHPARAVRLLDEAAGRQLRAAIEDADVVEAEESALEDVVADDVLAVHPPGEVEQQLVKDLFEEHVVGALAVALLDLVDPPGGPGVYRRIDVAERPFVRRDLTVGMHVPLAQQELELALGEITIDEGERDAVEREVPRRVPGILPLV